MEPFIGQIQAYGFNFAPRSWAFCDGQLLAINSNQALFSLLGTMYGGDGRTSFGLPDLRGRSIVHRGQGPGLANIPQGARGGTEVITLNANHLPPHNHSVLLGGGVGTSSQGNGAFLAGNAVADTIYSGAAGGGALNAGTVANAGAGQAFNSRNPYLAVTVSIALQGIFPSRN
ncbi:MAG: tail fiber protein [Bacteroidota bacterium]